MTTAFWCQSVLVLLFLCGFAQGQAMPPSPGPTSKPTMPLQAIGKLSTAEREEIYSVRVLRPHDAWRCPDMCKTLQWAQHDQMTDQLYPDRTDSLRNLLPWVRDFLVLSDNTVMKFRAEKGEEYIYCMFTPTVDNVHLRLWRDPFDVTRRLPQRIDLLRESPIEMATLEGMIDEIASVKLADRAALGELVKTRSVLAKLPLQKRLLSLPWTVRSFTLRRDCMLAHVECEVAGPRDPLVMELYVSLDGMQASIHGKKLESPSEIYDPKGAEKFDPMKDRIGPPTGENGGAK